MGVPKFYRWLSERYPKINQIVSDSTLLPEFDNLYLDMNGILHTCTHPNDDGLSIQLSERDIILGIFHYIDRIVTNIVRPRRVLYMAIDGVAPRAKMNQQRSRRFRSRKDMKEAKMIAQSKGEVVNDEAVFDSNCITPGTEFMAKISRHLRYFIQKKITEDPLWKSLRIIFSGHEVPGEGEHKIMAFIRDERSSGGLPPNTRHCMYGQDADLILLGLVTHEPHFTLLREVVDFSQNASRGKKGPKVTVKTTRDARFQLLHLSVLREYIWAELTRDLPEAMAVSMDRDKDRERERVVDDFVFLTFLVGNDFLPHMPSLDIGEEAFSLLFKIYRSLKPSWGHGCYLTSRGGVEDPARLEQFLNLVGDKEDEIFYERAADEANFRNRRRRSNQRFGRAEEVPSEAELANEEAKKQTTYEQAMIQMMGYVPEKPVGEKDYKGRLSSDRVYTNWFRMAKLRLIYKDLPATWGIDAASIALSDELRNDAWYYFEKFGVAPIQTEFHQRLRAAYVEGLLWCLAYYYRGCISWSWFFPYHYVPMISDLRDLPRIFAGVRFDLGEPFLPFEQLLGCLPGASSAFLPSPYARLMVSPDSPIIDFYPEDFEVDSNGKRNPWEAVNILPFIDASRLRAAVQEFCPPESLAPAEMERNRLGQVLEFRHDPTMSRKEPSCNPEVGLTDIPHCTAAFRVLPFSIHPGECFLSAVSNGTVIPTAGFPSLHVLDIQSVSERKIPVNVFGTASRYQTLVFQLKRQLNRPSASALAPRVLGRSAYLNWPLLHEAQVVGISDRTEEFRLKNVQGTNKCKIDVRKLTEVQSNEWRARAAEMQSHYLSGESVPGSGGVEIGNVELMIKARPLQGMRINRKTGARRKIFGKEEAEVPVHMVLWSCPAEDPRFTEIDNARLEERFPVGSRVTCLHGGHGHGCGGEVVGYRGNKVDVMVDLRPPEPPFGMVIAQSIKVVYHPLAKACAHLGLAPQVFGRIVASVMVEPGQLDLGLNLKQNGRFQLLGYARCVLKGQTAWSTSDTVRVIGSAPEERKTEVASWEFSDSAIRLVRQYKITFPQLFHGLARHQGSDRTLDAHALLGAGGAARIGEIAAWVDNLETAGLQRVPLTTRALPVEAVRAVQRGADVRQAVLVKNALVKKTLMQGLEPSQLLAYTVADHTEAPMDTGGETPDLGDRVVNMRAKGVPFGMWGTVVACHSHSACVEVVFDEEFIGGTTLHGMCSNYRGALVPWATVVKIHTKARLKALRAAASQGGSTASATRTVAAPGMAPSRSPKLAGRAGSSQTRQKVPWANVPPATNEVWNDHQGIGVAMGNTSSAQTPGATPALLSPAAVTSGAHTSLQVGSVGARVGSTGINISSTNALKGVLGIGGNVRNPGATATLGPGAGVPIMMRSTSGGSGTGASAVLKGMLGIKLSDANVDAYQTTRTDVEDGAQPTQPQGTHRSLAPPPAVQRNTSAAMAATADLKAMIGLGSGSGSAMKRPQVNEEDRSGASTSHGRPQAAEGTLSLESLELETGNTEDSQRLTSSSPTGVPAVDIRGRVSPRSAISMHPEAGRGTLDRRGGSSFRQAKGPDKAGCGFRSGRGVFCGGASEEAVAAPAPVVTATRSAAEMSVERTRGDTGGMVSEPRGDASKRGGRRVETNEADDMQEAVVNFAGFENREQSGTRHKEAAVVARMLHGQARALDETHSKTETQQLRPDGTRWTPPTAAMAAATTPKESPAIAFTSTESKVERLLSMIKAKKPMPESPSPVTPSGAPPPHPPPQMPRRSVTQSASETGTEAAGAEAAGAERGAVLLTPSAVKYPSVVLPMRQNPSGEQTMTQGAFTGMEMGAMSGTVGRQAAATAFNDGTQQQAYVQQASLGTYPTPAPQAVGPPMATPMMLQPHGYPAYTQHPTILPLQPQTLVGYPHAPHVPQAYVPGGLPGQPSTSTGTSSGVIPHVPRRSTSDPQGGHEGGRGFDHGGGR